MLSPALGFHSILKELLQVQQSLGYCPQFDALFDELTAQEHLELYTRLRGIPWKDEERVREGPEEATETDTPPISWVFRKKEKAAAASSVWTMSLWNSPPQDRRG